MVHGSTHTGAALESTPDGREGWFPYFVRKGVATYVVDQSGRGRSGFDHSVLHEAEVKVVAGDAAAAAALLPNFGRITDNGAWTAWFGHLLPPGSNITTGTLIRHGDPGDPEKPTDGRPHVAPLFPMSAVAEYYKQLVPNAEVTLPGSTCATCTPQNLSPANTWTPQNLALLVERLRLARSLSGSGRPRATAGLERLKSNYPGLTGAQDKRMSALTRDPGH
jgi:hypothetical protein